LLSINLSLWASNDCLTKQGYEFEKHSYLTGEYLIDSDTYLVIRSTESIVSPDGTVKPYCTSEYRYDVAAPQKAELLYERMTSTENARKVEIVMDGTTYTYNVQKGDSCYLGDTLTQNYDLYKDAAYTQAYEGTGSTQEDATVYAKRKE